MFVERKYLKAGMKICIEWENGYFQWAEAERKPQDTRADEVLGTRIPATPR